MDLENSVGGCSRSLKIGPFNRPYTTLQDTLLNYDTPDYLNVLVMAIRHL